MEYHPTFILSQAWDPESYCLYYKPETKVGKLLFLHIPRIQEQDIFARSKENTGSEACFKEGI